jgi:hypothetical protein
MSLIESLTEAQIARIPEFAERWTKIGLCTDPADRPRAVRPFARCTARAALGRPPGSSGAARLSS